MTDSVETVLVLPVDAAGETGGEELGGFFFACVDGFHEGSVALDVAGYADFFVVGFDKVFLRGKVSFCWVEKAVIKLPAFLLVSCTYYDLHMPK